jgi:uncharacterized protein
MSITIPVEHQQLDQRFVSRIDGLENVLDYRVEPGRLLFTRTSVDPSLQGRGIAAALVAAGFAHARDSGLKVVPMCSYVAVYARRHPEVHDLLA